jgi:hypothetical protein
MKTQIESGGIIDAQNVKAQAPQVRHAPHSVRRRCAPKKKDRNSCLQRERLPTRHSILFLPRPYFGFHAGRPPSGVPFSFKISFGLPPSLSMT